MKRLTDNSEIFAIVATLLWGINYVIVKAILQFVPERQFLLIRFTFTVIFFLSWLLLRKSPLRIKKEHWLAILALGMLGIGFYNIIWTFGIHRIPAANAALLISSSPIFTGLYSIIQGEEPVSIQRWVGTILAFLGIFFIIYWTPGTRFSLTSGSFIGNLLVLAAALLFALYAIIAKPLLNFYTPNELTAYAMSGGLGVLLPFCLSDRNTLNFVIFSPYIWLGLCYIILAGTIIAYVFWYKGIQKTSPLKTIFYHYLCPVVSMVLGALWLGEKVTPGQIGGAILVLIALIIVRWNGKLLSTARKRFFG